MVRVPLPELSRERRPEFVKVANRWRKMPRSIRTIAATPWTDLKKAQKDGKISETNPSATRRSSDHYGQSDQDIGDHLAKKEKDLLSV